MPRRARRSAGAEVAASAEALSDTTLDLEEQAFAQIAEVYDRLAADVAAALEEAPLDAPSDDVWVLIAVMVAAAEGRNVEIVNGMLAATLGAALAAIAVELAVIESTLSDDFDGAAAVALAQISAEQLIDDAQRAYAEAARQITGRTLADIEDAEAAWRTRKEDRAALIDRLTGTDVRRPGQSGRGIVRRPSTPAQQKAREVSIDSGNLGRETAMELFNDEVVARGGRALLFKQVLAKIDSRTTVVCLHAAGQIRPLGDLFDTLNGELDRPPFHWGCRSTVIPWAPGMRQLHRDEANRELQRRPRAERLTASRGTLGPRLSAVPPRPPSVPLPAELAADPTLRLEDVPLEHRIGYFRAHPDRFGVYPNGPGSWWVSGDDGRRHNLRV